ncbi:unnamed protein product [Phytomonas sp. EM1]|nr:unnamed protein product [Phytomonas sp. EM1]|eukprot:CCW59669.1 unnamed protein product [Phytomonas sp. isolate EM1]
MLATEPYGGQKFNNWCIGATLSFHFTSLLIIVYFREPITLKCKYTLLIKCTTLRLAVHWVIGMDICKKSHPSTDE